MRDHRGTDLLARSHLETSYRRVLETAIKKPFHEIPTLRTHPFWIAASQYFAPLEACIFSHQIV